MDFFVTLLVVSFAPSPNEGKKVKTIQVPWEPQLSETLILFAQCTMQMRYWTKEVVVVVFNSCTICIKKEKVEKKITDSHLERYDEHYVNIEILRQKGATELQNIVIN